MPMRRWFPLACLLLVVTLAWVAARALWPRPIRAITPAEAGLIWKECPLPGSDPTAEEAEACFGRPSPVLSDAEKGNLGRGDYENVQLTIGGDTYRAISRGVLPIEIYSLYRNGRFSRGLASIAALHWPFMWLHNIGGKLAWEIADEKLATIIHDGRDLRRLYGLDQAYRPYSLGGRLIFMARRGGEYFVMCGGRKVGTGFEQVTIAYCCETMLYSVQFGQGRYQFRGTRAGVEYIVEVRAAGD